MIRKGACALLTAGLLCLTPLAQAQRLNDAAPDLLFDADLLKGLDYGLVCPSGRAKELPAPNTHIGTIKQRTRRQKIEATTQVIPLVKGIAFGVDTATLKGTNLRGVKITVYHPAYKGTDVIEDSWTTDFNPKSSNLNFFVFEFPFEMVSGDWAFQATHQGRTLYSVGFKLVPPDQAPNTASLCKGGLFS